MLTLLACQDLPSTRDPGSEFSWEDTGVADEDVPSETEDTEITDDDDDVWRAFYEPAVVQTVEIELTEEAIEELNRGGRDEYVEGNCVVNGERFDAVGVRLKGSSTYETFEYCGWHDEPCKPAFKIKLNEFVVGQKLGEMERITLNNLTYDVTQAKEAIDYRVWEEAGMVVPKANYARVTVNGELFGLYVNVESMDEEWVKHRYADASGALWGTADDYADFTRRGVNRGWEIKSGSEDMSQIEAIKDAIDDFSGDFFGELDPWVDTAQFLDYWAWTIAIGNQDGYPFNQNDVFLYGDPDDGNRFDFIPWGMDEAWDETMSANGATCTLSDACYDDDACVAELEARVEAALSQYEAIDVAGYAQQSFEVSAADMLEDPRRPFTIEDVEAYRAYLLTQIAAWPDRVRGQMGL